MKRLLCLAAFCVGLTTSLAQADGLFYKLPKDGTWATYQVDGSVEADRGKDRGKERLKGTIRMASVGQVTEGGQLCRWMETTWELGTQEGDKPTKPQKQCFKVLIPEKFLVKGETPTDHAIRAWERRGEKGEPQKLNDMTKSPLRVVLSGPLKDAKPLPKAEVESKLGKLQCEGVAGSLDISGPGSLKLRVTFENRLHPDAPFGLVSSHWTAPVIETTETTETTRKKGTPEEEPGTVHVEPETVHVVGGKMEWNLKLIDFGDKATTEMPDAK